MRKPFNNLVGVERVDIPTTWTWPSPGTDLDKNILEHPDPKAVNKKDPTKWKRITDPQEVKYYVLQLRNRLHCGQAKDTPFAREPVEHLLDWQASYK